MSFRRQPVPVAAFLPCFLLRATTQQNEICFAVKPEGSVLPQNLRCCGPQSISKGWSKVVLSKRSESFYLCDGFCFMLCGSGWPQTPCTAEDNLQLWNLLPSGLRGASSSLIPEESGDGHFLCCSFSCPLRGHGLAQLCKFQVERPHQQKC